MLALACRRGLREVDLIVDIVTSPLELRLGQVERASLLLLVGVEVVLVGAE